MTRPSTSHVRWLLIVWLFVLSAVAFLDRVNISIAASSIATAYHLTNVQLGTVFSALLWGYALFQTLGGRLADRIGPRRVLAAGVVWWGIFTAATASVPADIHHGLALFVAIRFLLGAGEAVVFPASNQFVARWIPTPERGVANGWIFAGVGVGAGLSPPLISYLILNYGWRASFWACAAIGLIAGGIWFLQARDSPEEHSGVSLSELALIQAGIATSADAKSSAVSGEPALLPWRKLLASKEVLAVTVSYFCFGYVAWIFFSWFYIYLAKVRGLNLKASAIYAMLPFIAMAIGCAVGGSISDRLTRLHGPKLGRGVMAAAAMMAAAVFLALGAQVGSARLASVVLAGGAGALYLAQSSFWSVTADIAGRSSGSVSGFMNTGGQIGGAVTAQVTPWIAQHFGWTVSFLVAAALCLVGAAAWLLVDPERSLAFNSDSGVPVLVQTS
jgi:ACS family glucarate transporter-like MFS transporter